MKAIVLVCLSVLSATACSVGRDEEPESVSGREYWYILQDGDLLPGNIPASNNETTFLPWTVQQRVVDLIPYGNRVHLAVNGHGIVSVEHGDQQTHAFQYYYYPIIFDARTITLLIPEEQTILCHLYFNKTLNTIGEEDLKIQGVSLFKLIPFEDNFRFVVLPFQKKNPDWESTTFLPLGDRRFYVEWKYTDEEVTRFKYTKVDLARNREESGNREEFLEAYGFQEMKSAWLPKGLKYLFDSSVEELLRDARATAIHFLLRAEDDLITKRFRYMPEGFVQSEEMTLSEVPVYQKGSFLYALLQDGTVFWSDLENTRKGRHVLPALPKGFVYRNFVVTDTEILATWEESRFFNVGSAGLYIAEFSVE